MFNGALLRVWPDMQMGGQTKGGGYSTHACAHLDQLVPPNDDGPTSTVGVLSSRYRRRVIVPERRHRIDVNVISGESGWLESENYRRKHSVRDKAGVGQATKHVKEGDNCGQIKTASRQNDRTLKS